MTGQWAHGAAIGQFARDISTMVSDDSGLFTHSRRLIGQITRHWVYGQGREWSAGTIGGNRSNTEMITGKVSSSSGMLAQATC